MKFKRLAQMFLSLCLAAQLNFAYANPNYDEEITLPVGTNFDLEMEEITRYEYDGNYVKAQTVNGKEQFILQKTGDTIINVIMEENGQKTEMRVLVHIVTEQQFNGTEAPKTESKPATPATTTTKPATNTPSKTTAPATTTQTKPAAPAATQPATSTSAKTATPAATTPAKTQAPATPVATTPTKADNPATPATTTPTKADNPTTPATTVTEPTSAATVAPQSPSGTIYGTPISRPANVTPANTIEAAKLKSEHMAFDVLDLVNAERAKAGLTPLTMTRDLMDTAIVRSKEIPKRFSHTRPNNTRYFTALAMQGSVREENIAAGQTTAQAVVKAWMAAPNSKEIILNPAFRELGVGYFETVGASYSCYWVQIFRG